jgi:hypothetical protein
MPRKINDGKRATLVDTPVSSKKPSSDKPQGRMTLKVAQNGSLTGEPKSASKERTPRGSLKTDSKDKSIKNMLAGGLKAGDQKGAKNKKTQRQATDGSEGGDAAAASNIPLNAIESPKVGGDDGDNSPKKIPTAPSSKTDLKANRSKAGSKEREGARIPSLIEAE